MKTIRFASRGGRGFMCALCLLFVLWACENEDPITPNPQLEKLNAIATQFNPAHFKKSIPFDFEVSWTPQHARYSEDLQSMYYEFPIEYTSAFNPDALAKTEEGGSKYTLRYSVLVTEKAPDEFRFYVGRYYEEGAHDALKNGKLFENTSEYTGFVHVLNTKGKLVFAKRIQDGVEDPKKWVAEEFASTSNQQRMVEDCVIITTYHYIDWYNVDPQGNYYYIKSTLEDTSLTQVCHSYWLPDLVRTGGGGASGPYVGVGDGGAYQDCGGTTQRYVEEGTCTYNISPQVKECEEGYVLNDEGECVEEEKIINNLTDPCANAIFRELVNGIFESHPLKPEVHISNPNITTLNFSESILQLFNDSEYTHLVIRNGNIGTSNATTVGATITLNNNYLANATKLSIARTMIHESVHAYINALYSNVVSFNSFTFKEKVEKYAIDKGYTIGSNEFHHNFMSQYVDAIAYSLYEWDIDFGTGGNLGWSYYTSIAWGGLFQTDNSGTIISETDSFRELIPNPIDRQNIANIVFNELKGNGYAQGTKCD